MNGTAEQRAKVKRHLREMTNASSLAYTAIDVDDPEVLEQALDRLDLAHRELVRDVLVLLTHGHEEEIT